MGLAQHPGSLRPCGCCVRARKLKGRDLAFVPPEVVLQFETRGRALTDLESRAGPCEFCSCACVCACVACVRECSPNQGHIGACAHAPTTRACVVYPRLVRAPRLVPSRRKEHHLDVSGVLEGYQFPICKQDKARQKRFGRMCMRIEVFE